MWPLVVQLVFVATIIDSCSASFRIVVPVGNGFSPFPNAGIAQNGGKWIENCFHLVDFTSTLFHFTTSFSPLAVHPTAIQFLVNFWQNYVGVSINTNVLQKRYC